jgi:hypothetical protein
MTRVIRLPTRYRRSQRSEKTQAELLLVQHRAPSDFRQGLVVERQAKTATVVLVTIPGTSHGTPIKMLRSFRRRNRLRLHRGRGASRSWCFSCGESRQSRSMANGPCPKANPSREKCEPHE